MTSIVFAQSTNVLDAKTYTLTLIALPAGSNLWIAAVGSAPATIYYVNPCLTAVLNVPTLAPMTSSVLK